MEGWGKIGVQRASVLYPNSYYNEPCYIEVQVYKEKKQTGCLFRLFSLIYMGTLRYLCSRYQELTVLKKKR